MIKPMLAHKVSENRIDFSEKVFIQPKLNGVRCVFTKDGAYHVPVKSPTTYNTSK